MDVFTRRPPWNLCRTRTPRRWGHQARRAEAEGNEFATLDRELPAEAVRRTKRPEDRNAIAVVDRGIQTLKKDLAWPARAASGATTFSRPLRPTTRGPTRRCTAPRKTWRSSREVQAPPRQRRQVPAQQGPDKPCIKAVEDAGFNPKYGDVQQLRAVDSMTVRSTEGRRPC